MKKKKEREKEIFSSSQSSEYLQLGHSQENDLILVSASIDPVVFLIELIVS